MATCGNCGKEHWQCVCSPVEIEPEMIDCPDCDGDGKWFFSCCNDELHSCDYEGGDCLCPSCQEHCSIDDAEICETCKGKGVINKAEIKTWSK
jgi:hypothetical protein